MAGKSIDKNDIIKDGAIESIIKDFQGLYEQIEASSDALKSMAGSLKEIKMPTGNAKSLAEFEAKSRDVNNVYENKIVLEKELIKLDQEKAKLDAIKTKNEIAQTKELERQIKAEERRTVSIQRASREYVKLSKYLTDIRNRYNDLQAKQAQYHVMTHQEISDLEQLGNEVVELDAKLKQIDSNSGQFQRNVGNYAQAWNGLGNSINQITRELPAFTYSVQTGFMAISNNIPMFVDEIAKISKVNKTLRAEGKETTSVLNQVASALFSWQTALSLGVTLLTVYGKEIGNWVSELWGADEALESLNQRQVEFNKSRIEGRKDAQSEIIELRKNLAVVKDQTLSMDIRKEALKQLRQSYYYMFKDLTDAQILEGNYSDAVTKTTKALEKRKALERQTDISVENRKRRIEIEAELELIQGQIPALQERLKLRKQQAMGDAQFSGALANAENTYSKALKERAVIAKELELLNKNEIENEAEIIRLKKETIELDIKEEKESKTKKKKDDTIDYAKAIRDLNTALIENDRVRTISELTNKLQDDIDSIQAKGIKALEYRVTLERKYYEDLIDIHYRYNQIDKKEKDEELKLQIEHNKKMRAEQMAFYDLYIGNEERKRNLETLKNFYNDRGLAYIKYGKDKEKFDEAITKAELEMNIKRLQDSIDLNNARLEVETESYEKLSAIKNRTLTDDETKEKDSYGRSIGELKNNIQNANIELQTFRFQQAEKSVSLYKKLADNFSSFIKAIQIKMDQVFDKQINNENRLIDRSKQRIDYLTQASALGTQTATGSILAEERKQEEAYRRIEKIQKNQARMQFITGILSSWNSKIASGTNATKALGSTISESAVLGAALKSLPSFDVGADRLTEQGKGIDNKRGFLAINHPNERIMTAEQNKEIGYDVPNSLVTSVMKSFNKGDLDNKTVIVQPNYGDIIKPLQDTLDKGFSKITTINYDVEKATELVLKVTKERISNGNKTIDHRKFKA